mmetsp:Transcript_41970/g.98472  ORF Transcript_41970/g.98472 Transcript_41970/m.98472 type:complete len:350 (-) Transcript_41970:43-1092(-)
MHVYTYSDGLLCTSLRFRHTVLPNLFMRSDIWVFLMLHVGASIGFQLGWLHDATDASHLTGVDNHFLEVLVFLTILLTVFMTHALVDKYTAIYGLTRALFGALADTAFSLSLHLSKTYSRLAARYMLASVILFFMEMKPDLCDADWQELEGSGLLLPREIEKLRSIDGARSERSLVVLHWAADVASGGFHAEAVPATQLVGTMQRISKARAAQQQVLDSLACVFPPSYVHLVQLAVCACLAILAYAMAMTMSLWGLVAYSVTLVVFLGLLELGDELANPFGDDETDFPMITWLAEAIEQVVVIIECSYPSSSKKWESELKASSGLHQQLQGFGGVISAELDDDDGDGAE